MKTATRDSCFTATRRKVSGDAANRATSRRRHEVRQALPRCERTTTLLVHCTRTLFYFLMVAAIALSLFSIGRSARNAPVLLSRFLFTEFLALLYMHIVPQDGGRDLVDAEDRL